MASHSSRTCALAAALALCTAGLAAIGCGDEAEGPYTLFDCPTSPNSIDDFAPYRDPASVEQVRATIHAEISSRIAGDQLAPCADPGDWDECVEGSYTAADGAQVDYRLASATTTAEPEDFYQNTETVAEETAHVALPQGAAAWQALEWTETHTVLTGMDGISDTRAFGAAWTGSLAPDWPADFALEGSVIAIQQDDGPQDAASLAHASCDFRVDVWGYFDKSTQIWIYDHGLLVDGAGNCAIDGECVGVVDVETWELVGGCE